MKPTGIKTICTAVIAMLLCGCSGLLFFPSQQWAQTPDQRGYQYQAVTIPTANGQMLSAWLLPQRNPERQQPRGAVIFFHGNAENISTHIASVYWLTDEGYDLLLVDYRGYGKSDGYPALESSFEDIRHSIDWFKQRYPDPMPKYLIGQSLGASMSGYVLATQPEYRQHFSAVALESGFARYQRVAREALSRSWITWLFQYPLSWTMPRRYDLIDHIAQISPTPLLILHGTRDQVVPYQHGLDLMAAADQKTTEFLSYDGPHIGGLYKPENRQRLVEFFSQHLTPPTTPVSATGK